MGDYGIKVSLPGKDITSTEPRDYVFNSAYGSVKVVQEPPNKTYEELTVNAGSNATLTVAHNLGFIPLVMVFTELTPGSGRWYNGVALGGPLDPSTGAVTPANVTSGMEIDSTNVYLKYNNTGGSNLTIKIYYFIFGDAGS